METKALVQEYDAAIDIKMIHHMSSRKIKKEGLKNSEMFLKLIIRNANNWKTSNSTHKSDKRIIQWWKSMRYWIFKKRRKGIIWEIRPNDNPSNDKDIFLREVNKF